MRSHLVLGKEVRLLREGEKTGGREEKKADRLDSKKRLRCAICGHFTNLLNMFVLSNSHYSPTHRFNTDL